MAIAENRVTKKTLFEEYAKTLLSLTVIIALILNSYVANIIQTQGQSPIYNLFAYMGVPLAVTNGGMDIYVKSSSGGSVRFNGFTDWVGGDKYRANNNGVWRVRGLTDPGPYAIKVMCPDNQRIHKWHRGVIVYSNMNTQVTIRGLDCDAAGTGEHDRQGCYGNSIYWFDSDGRRNDLIRTCGSGSQCGCRTSGGTITCSCTEAEETDCGDYTHRRCHGGDVYLYNDCNQRGSKAEDCGSLDCSGGECVQPIGPQPDPCAPECNSIKCYNGQDLWCYDKCNQRTRTYQDCEYGCSGGRCNSPPAPPGPDTTSTTTIFENGERATTTIPPVGPVCTSGQIDTQFNTCNPGAILVYRERTCTPQGIWGEWSFKTLKCTDFGFQVCDPSMFNPNNPLQACTTPVAAAPTTTIKPVEEKAPTPTAEPFKIPQEVIYVVYAFGGMIGLLIMVKVLQGVGLIKTGGAAAAGPIYVRGKPPAVVKKKGVGGKIKDAVKKLSK
jgi:hypothetical protein